MTENNEVNLDTLSPIAKQALENLAKEGKTPAPANTKLEEDVDGEIKDAPAPKEEKKADEDKKPDDDKAKLDADKKALEDANVAKGLNPDGSVKEAKKPRDIKFVEAYKLKIAESQKETAEKKLQEALSEIEKLSKKSDLSTKDKENLDDAMDELSTKYPDIDPNLLKDLQNSIIKKISTPKEVQEALKELQTIKAERDESFESIEYSKDFDKDVMPILKAEHPNLSDEAISQIKDSLKTFAYTEEYAKIPLSKIYKAEKESLNIPIASPKKKSTESDKSFRTRDSGAVDFDNMTDEAFNNLSDEEKLKFSQHKKAGGWK